jgi:hypothetical protein
MPAPMSMDLRLRIRARDRGRQSDPRGGAAVCREPKLKALLRKAAARTKDQLWATIARLLDACAAAECANYLRHCGYGST